MLALSSGELCAGKGKEEEDKEEEESSWPGEGALLGPPNPGRCLPGGLTPRAP